MAIEKNSFKVARFNKEINSPHTRDSRVSSDTTMRISSVPLSPTMRVKSTMRIFQSLVLETEMEEVEAEIKRQKKAFRLITPTVHNGFSFSIIHLLSSVRMAMITLLSEDSSESGKHLDKNIGDQNKGSQQEDTNPNMDVNTSEPSVQANVPSLSVQEIVKKSTKSWQWIGPAFSPNLFDSEPIEEVTSPDAWGLSHKMLVKLVDSYANWLKNSQETLQQIGSLPDPPLTSMQISLDEKERFNDLKAQKSLHTISSSSEEVGQHGPFPTWLSMVKNQLLPRCAGKLTSKALGHFMLKRGRHMSRSCVL